MATRAPAADPALLDLAVTVTVTDRTVPGPVSKWLAGLRRTGRSKAPHREVGR
jgi:hypothetical protein